jgi:hypothetical protein
VKILGPADEKAFDGGFGALVKWCREQTNAEWALNRLNCFAQSSENVRAAVESET